MRHLEERSSKEDPRMIQDEINIEINRQINIMRKKLVELQDRVKRLEK